MNQLRLSESEQPSINQNTNNFSDKLGSCPDCGKQISRLALSCPNCGRGFSSRHITITSRKGWVGTIASGVILGYIGITIINFILFFIVMILFAGVIGSAFQKPAPSTPYSQTYK